MMREDRQAETPAERSRARRRWPRFAGGVVLAILVIAGSVWGWRAVRRWRIEAAFRQLRVAVGTHQDADAVALAATILRLDPQHVDAAILGAEAALRQGDLGRCVRWLELAAARPHRRRLRVFIELGRIQGLAGRLNAAEDALRRALETDPDDASALQLLANLLAVQGRRFESLPLRYRLIQLGHGTLQNLVFLGHHRAVLDASDELRRALATDPDFVLPHMGLGRLALRQNRLDDAERHFRAILQAKPDWAPAWAWLGHVLLRQSENVQGEAEALRAWFRKLPAKARSHPETWVVLGLWAQRRGDWLGASRCFWEALKLDPDHSVALYQSGVSLTAAGEGDRAEPLRKRAAVIQELELLCSEIHESEPTAAKMFRCAALCEEAGRLPEALAWCRLILRHTKVPGIDPSRAPTSEELNAFFEARRNSEDLMQRLQRIDVRTAPRVAPHRRPEKLVDLGFARLPSFERSEDAVASFRKADLRLLPAFAEVTRQVGIEFHYFNGDDPATEGRRMFEFTGGGVSVLDYDQDGWPDLYFTQGCPWPPDDGQDRYQDRLYRNRQGRRFRDVTGAAGLGDRRFTQGAAAGDFNDDGWPDLFVANVGENRLYVNNGDGTVTEVTQQAGIRGPWWTTSAAMADVTGDGIVDLYEVNYLAGGRAFELVCARGGKMRACSPTEFPDQQDRLWVGRGDGTFEDATNRSGIRTPGGKGLGCLIADFDRRKGLEIFVANDTTANFFFRARKPLARFREEAAPLGLAYNRNGVAQACMGIGVEDVDADGRLDLFVTNFHKEWNTLYRQQPLDALLFLDESDAWGVTKTSLDTLGFGCQFLDGELDGLPDLVITNGHVDDFSHQGDPYEMPPQYLRNLGGRFVEWPAKELGAFFTEPRLGRGLARLDYDRDGKEDFAVSYLDRPVALVANRARRAGHFLSVQLVARTTPRDAIGTGVTVVSGDWKRYRQQTAGDGYMATNEHALVFGLGDHRRVDLEVRWPDGSREVWRNLKADVHIKVVQGKGWREVSPDRSPERRP